MFKVYTNVNTKLSALA